MNGDRGGEFDVVFSVGCFPLHHGVSEALIVELHPLDFRVSEASCFKLRSDKKDD